MKGYEYVQLEYMYPLIKILSIIMLVFLIVSCDQSTDYGSSRTSQTQSRFIPKESATEEETKKGVEECYNECVMYDEHLIICEDKCYIKVKY